MSTTNLVLPDPFPAVQRTALLHRMLVVRHLAEHRAVVPSPNPDDVAVDFHVGEEAAAAGVLTALGPCDAMMPAADFTRAVAMARGDLRTHRATVTVCLFEGDADGWLAVARRDRLPMLFCRRPDHLSDADPHQPLTEETVDSLDIEAVVPRIRERLRTIRAGGGACQLSLHNGSLADPIETLVVRMFADHQLDANALRAIDADAGAQVAAMLAAPSGGS